MSAVLREQQHDEAKKLLRQGQTSKALQILLDAEHLYGPHIGIYCDMAAIHYLHGNHQACQLTLKRINIALEQHGIALSPETLSRALVFAGKLHEEFNEVHIALRYYHQATQIKNLEADQKIKSLAQNLRLLSWLRKKDQLPQLYSDLLRATEIHGDLEIEVEHSLMMAELQLFGSQTALQRLQRLMQRNDLYPHDKKFLLADFAEAVLYNKALTQDLRSYLLQQFQSVPENDFTAFEFTIYQVVQNNSQINYLKIVEQERYLSHLDNIILLMLVFKLSENSEEQREARERVLFLISTLDKESKYLLIEKWNLNKLADSQVTEPLILNNVGISYRDKTLAMKTTSFAYRALFLFQVQKSYDLHIFIQKIFDQPQVDEYTLEKNRVAISRLNKTLENLTGIQQLIQLNKHSIGLADNFSIQTSANLSS